MATSAKHSQMLADALLLDDVLPLLPTQRRRSRALAPEPEAPLGSLTQSPARDDAGCPACGGMALTEISMVLTDGTPVRFTSCRNCEHRRWEADGAELAIGDVLDRSRRGGA